MPHAHDVNGPRLVVDLVHDAVLPYADAPITLGADKLPAAWRTRIVREPPDMGNDPPEGVGGGTR